VPGNHARFVGKGEKAGFDGVDDLSVVTAGQVGAADAAGKKRVACKNHFERNEVKADGALGVTWGVDDLGWVAGEADLLAVREALVWQSGFRGGDAEPGGLLVHHGEEGQVVFVEENGRSGDALELERAADMIDVGMGDEDLLKLEAKRRKARVNAADFVAGINDDGIARGFVAQKSAVALQRADGEGFEDHGIILEPDNIGSAALSVAVEGWLASRAAGLRKVIA